MKLGIINFYVLLVKLDVTLTGWRGIRHVKLDVCNFLLAVKYVPKPKIRPTGRQFLGLDATTFPIRIGKALSKLVNIYPQVSGLLAH